MKFSLLDKEVQSNAKLKLWAQKDKYWQSMSEATKDFSAPVVATNLPAVAHNAQDLVRRAGGIPIRVASKSIRSRDLIEKVLEIPGFQGVLAYTLSEAIWLSERITDILVAYPSTDRAAIHALTENENALERVTVMIDSVDQLDLIDSVVSPEKRKQIRVCLDFDASWRAPVLGNVGVLRSPVHEPGDLKALAAHVISRKGFKLVAVMSYEAQIAGVGNETEGNTIMGRVMGELQRRSANELRERRRVAIEMVQEITELEFVNGGGTGSIESTAAESVITEVAAGSGLLGPHLFDNYAHFKPAPATAFALDVVRKARPESATVLGGGWIASGVAGTDRLPQVTWPEGLKYSPREGAGEVQTPLLGSAAKNLQIGDRVWFRHTKSGEIMEHSNEIVLVNVDETVGTVPTYRGEGKSFL